MTLQLIMNNFEVQKDALKKTQKELIMIMYEIFNLTFYKIKIKLVAV